MTTLLFLLILLLLTTYPSEILADDSYEPCLHLLVVVAPLPP